jgi:hypothetical protein
VQLRLLILPKHFFKSESNLIPADTVFIFLINFGHATKDEVKNRQSQFENRKCTGTSRIVFEVN